MDGAVSAKVQQDFAGVRKIVRVVGNGFPVLDNRANIILEDAAFEHPLNCMPAENQVFIFQSFTLSSWYRSTILHLAHKNY